MNDFPAPRFGGTMGEIFVATAAAVAPEGVTLLLAGQSSPTQKAYLRLTASAISAGDTVLCARISGTIVVLGRVGAKQDPGGGSVTVDDELSTESENPVQNKVITSALDTLDTEKYELPAGGIPEADLADAVQSSLEKADSALLTARGTAIPKNSDLDDYKTPGNYYIATASIAGTITAGGAPLPYSSNTSYRLSVLQGGGIGIIQILQVTGYAAGAIYIRLYLSSTWYAWQQLVRSGMSGASLASPSFSGTPTAPTAASGTNTTQIATTAFVQSAAQTEAANAVSTFVRPNLLDNWYFGNGVINQRGQSNYTNSGYCIDRWKMSSSFTLNLLTDSLQIVSSAAWNGIMQIINISARSGDTFTFSFLGDASSSSKAVYYGVGYMNGSSRVIVSEKYVQLTTTKNLYTLTGTLPAEYDGELLYVNIWSRYASETINLYAAKLELGDTQTLAHQEDGEWVLNELPDPTAEMAKCRRYYQRFTQVGASIGYVIANVIAYSATSANLTLRLGMRAPTGNEVAVSYSDISHIVFATQRIDAGISATGVSGAHVTDSGDVVMNLNAANALTPATIYNAALKAGVDAWIAFSTEP